MSTAAQKGPWGGGALVSWEGQAGSALPNVSVPVTQEHRRLQKHVLGPLWETAGPSPLSGRLRESQGLLTPSLGLESAQVFPGRVVTDFFKVFQCHTLISKDEWELSYYQCL